MGRNVALVVFLLFAFEINGQINPFGTPLIKNYSTQLTQGSEQSWCITKDKFGIMYFGTQDKGVLRYDGTSWKSIKIFNNPRIYSLDTDLNGFVFVGAASEFGYLQPGESGDIEYVSLASRVDSVSKIRSIYSIEVLDDKVYFQSPEFIYIYNVTDDSLYVVSLEKYKLKIGFRLASLNGRLILTDNSEGVFEFKEDKLTPLPGGDFFKGKICTVLLPFDDAQILVGTYFEGLFLYNPENGSVKDDFVEEELNNRLKVVNVYSGAVLNNDLFAVGTTDKEGILIFNKKGQLVQQLNTENSDLEDNAIMALYSDQNYGSELWISTNGFISKAYLNIPLGKYAGKQGIKTGVNEICYFNGSLYLSSDAGVLKSHINEKNFFSFRELPGVNTQVFPLTVIKEKENEFLLAGSINGIYQISKDDRVVNVLKNSYGYPGIKEASYSVKKIVQSSLYPDIVYFGLETGGILVLRNEGTRWKYVTRVKQVSGLVAGIIEKKEGGLWFISDDPSYLYNIEIIGNDTLLTQAPTGEEKIELDFNSLALIGDEVFITAANGLYKISENGRGLTSDNSITKGISEGKYSYSIYSDPDGDIWYSGYDRKNFDILFRNSTAQGEPYQGVLNLLPNAVTLNVRSIEGKTYILKSKSVYVVDKNNLTIDSTGVNTMFVRITVGADSVIMNGSFFDTYDNNRRLPVLKPSYQSVPEFSYDMNNISFEWTTTYYTDEMLTEYSYKLDGFDADWSGWVGISYGSNFEAAYSKKEYSGLPHGKYTFRVRSRTLTGLSGKDLNYDFIVLKPWYGTIAAFFLFMILGGLLLYAVIKTYTRRLKNENIRLEGIVAERTAIVVKQKDELEASIHYASRIQRALLPSEVILSENIKSYFVLFKPRDIVSGDFYWMTRKEDRLYIVAADCTGHGVPGAFMSLLGMSFLDEIIDKNVAPKANTILNELRLHVTDSLKQVGDEDEAKDGIDMSLLVIDFNTNRVEFSGAYNPCFRVRSITDGMEEIIKEQGIEMAEGSLTNGKYLLETIYATKMPIGISSRMDEDFVLHEWDLEKGVSYYLFSDGYLDQFGGPYGRKYMKMNFKKLLLKIQDFPMEKQKEMLDKNLQDWMGDNQQVDDILVLGIRIDQD
jgi:serine phosphatase RsbU (regulator of sigma subunit)